jgi:adenylate kinase family enzyme
MKVHIVGGMGAGKTTLAHALARMTRVPLYSLDDVAMQDGLDQWFQPRCPLTRRIEDVHHIASTPAWITEGSFLGWTRELLEQSDVIVWLDTPVWQALPRVVVRHVQEYVDQVRCARGRRARLRALRHPHLLHLVRFVHLTWNYYTAGARTHAFALTRAATLIELSPFQNKVIRLTGVA